METFLWVLNRHNCNPTAIFSVTKNRFLKIIISIKGYQKGLFNKTTKDEAFSFFCWPSLFFIFLFFGKNKQEWTSEKQKLLTDSLNRWYK